MKSQLSKILDESAPAADYGRKNLAASNKLLEPLDDDPEALKDCTPNVYHIADPEAKHRLKMIISGEVQAEEVRNILNWPSSLSYRFKSLLGALLSPSFMIQCLRLPTFVFYSVEAFIFIGVILLPVLVLESVFYPIFRLLFGVLYPAYASYKAVRTRDVKKYVSLADVYTRAR